MQTVMYTSTIFGPIHSRRLGSSLGVNLMPADGKICSFDCLYCEAGFNAQGPGKAGIPAREQVCLLLEDKLRQMKQNGEPLDNITFSGNGEPTLHPDFEGVVDDVLRLRDKYFPDVSISVLCNSTRLSSEAVCRALAKVDNNILKLDSTNPRTVRLLDRPADPAFDIAGVIERIGSFGRNCIVQTMLTRGSHNGEPVDNTTDAEIEGLIEAYKKIRPRSIMLYTVDRPTPELSLVRVPADEMKARAEQIERLTGIPVQVSA